MENGRGSRQLWEETETLHCKGWPRWKGTWPRLATVAFCLSLEIRTSFPCRMGVMVMGSFFKTITMAGSRLGIILDFRLRVPDHCHQRPWLCHPKDIWDGPSLFRSIFYSLSVYVCSHVWMWVCTCHSMYAEMRLPQVTMFIFLFAWDGMSYCLPLCIPR